MSKMRPPRPYVDTADIAAIYDIREYLILAAELAEGEEGQTLATLAAQAEATYRKLSLIQTYGELYDNEQAQP